MKNLKKVLALVMAFAMAFTMMAGAAYTDQDDIQATDAVELLATLNVMTGKGDGMFHPNDTITRAEICRIIYTIRNEGNDNANAYADMQTSFQDLTSADDWAKGYIKHCQSVNLISGRDAAGTIFGPQDPVTGVELAVICLRVLGYDPAKAGIGGESWSTKTIGLASEAGLLKGVNMESVTGPCERQWAAQIMANMLDAYTVTWSTDSDSYSRYGDNNALNPKVGKEYMKLYTSVGTLSSVSGSNLSLTMDLSDKADSDAVSGTTADTYAYATNFTKVDKDYSSLLGQKVKVLFRNAKANEVIGVYALADNSTNMVEASGVESDGKKVKFGGKSYSIERIYTDTTASNRNDYYNDYISVSYIGIDGKEQLNKQFISQAGVKYTPVDADSTSATVMAFDSSFFDDWNSSSAMMQFVDSDNNGRFDSVIVIDYAAAEVTSATSTKIIAGETYNYSDHNIDEGIAQGDWVSISYNRFDDCLDIKKIDVATGKLDGLKKDSTSAGNKDHAITLTKRVTSDGKKIQYNEYRVDSTWFNEATDTAGHTDINTVKAGDNIDYILLNGAAWKVKRVGTGSLEDVVDVAMVVNVEENGFDGKRAKLQFFNDTTDKVEIDSNSDMPHAGQLYEYSVSGGKYTFEPVKRGDAANSPYKDYYGDYTFEGPAAYPSDGKRDVMGGKTIDDNAKVILYTDNGTSAENDNDSDVITGKQLKTLDLTQVQPITNGQYFTAEISGLTRTAAIALQVKALPTGNLESHDYYGYILDDAIGSGPSNEASYQLLIEGGTEAITVYERGVTAAKLAQRKANTLIGYKSLAAEDSDGKRFIDDVKSYDIGDKNFGVAAAKVATNNASAKVNGFGMVDGSNVLGDQEFERDITANTVVFYVNSKDKEGTTVAPSNSSLSPLDYNANLADRSKFAEVDNGTKFANCLYLIKDSDDFEVLVIDYTDRMIQGPAVTEAITKMGNTVLTLDKKTLSIAKDEDATLTATARNFGTTALTPSVTVTPDGLAASVTPASSITNNGTFKVALNAAKAATPGKYTVTVTLGSGEGAKTATATVTVVGAEIGNVNDPGDNQLSFSTWTGSGSAAPTAGLLPSYDFKADGIVGANANYTAAVKFEDASGKEITTALTENDLKNLNVVIKLTPKDGYAFADANSVVAPPLWGQTANKGKDSDGNIVLTYNYKKAASLSAGDLTGSATENATTIERKLAENGELELTTALPAADVNVEKGQTLTLTTAQTDLSKLTGKGNVVLTGANASSVAQYIPSDKKVSISSGTSNTFTRGVEFSGTGKIDAFDPSTSVADIAREADSTTVTPVQFNLSATQVPANSFIKAIRIVNGVEKPVAGRLGTGFNVDDDPGLELNMLLGDKVSGIKVLVFNGQNNTFTPAADATPDATYTFTAQ